MALAYFITFTTYGTWLHGTDKGQGSVDDEHNAYGSPFLAPDPEKLAESTKVMSQPPYLLDESRRSIVRDAIVNLSAEKGWRLLAVHVRSNHVHLVVSADREPGRLMSDVKGRASRDLNRAGLDQPGRIRWTRHGSTRHLFEMSVVQEKIRYTLDEQGERMAYFDHEEEQRTK